MKANYRLGRLGVALVAFSVSISVCLSVSVCLCPQLSVSDPLSPSPPALPEHRCRSRWSQAQAPFGSRVKQVSAQQRVRVFCYKAEVNYGTWTKTLPWGLHSMFTTSQFQLHVSASRP